MTTIISIISMVMSTICYTYCGSEKSKVNPIDKITSITETATVEKSVNDTVN